MRDLQTPLTVDPPGGQSRINRETLLRLAPQVRLTIAGEQLIVEGTDDAVYCDAAMLLLLNAFRQPRTLEAALATLQTTTRQDWMTVSAQALELLAAGVLQSHDGAAVTSTTDHGFGYVEPHIAMLADEARTHRYIEAIRRAVRPGDVVLDLGTGSGVLAVAAAQAGARQVYAIERTGMADIAEQMFARNGVADRITLVRDTSTRVTLPERARVLTSEILGTEPFSERILEYTRDAIERLLMRDCAVIPRRMRVLARGVQVTDAVMDEHLVTAPIAERWARAYGIDFTALADTASRRAPWFTVPVGDASRWTALTPTVELFEINLADPPKPPIQAAVTTAAKIEGRLDGIIVFWEIELDEYGRLSIDPLSALENCAWGTAVWLANERPYVKPGQKLKISFRYSSPRAAAEIEIL